MLSHKKKECALVSAFGDIEVTRGCDGRFIASVQGHFTTSEGNMPIYAINGTRREAISDLFDFVMRGAKEHPAQKLFGLKAATSCVHTDEGVRVIARDKRFTLLAP